MCLIIFDKREDKKRVAKDVFRRSEELNPHGMGIMWSQDEKLHSWTTLDDFDGVWMRYASARAQKLRVAVHFRRGTVAAENSIENVHPFIIRPGFAFMHNGTITDITTLLPSDKSMSDTRYINKHLFQTFPKGFLQSPIHRIAIKELIHGDRMFFMDGHGGFTIINEASMGAQWKNGVWYSKGYEKLKYYLDGIKSYTTHGQGWNQGKNITSVAAYNYNRVVGYGHDADETGAMSLNERIDWWNMSLEEREETRRVQLVELTTPAKKLTKAERRAKRKADKAAAKAAKSRLSGIIDISGRPLTQSAKAAMGKLDHWRGQDPTPSHTANLFFDYGLLHRLGYSDTRLDHVGRGMLHGYQLWAIGDGGKEQPSPVHTKGSHIVGQLYKISQNHTDVIDSMDDRHGCQIRDPESSVYLRRYMKVSLQNTGEVYAWVYTYNVPLSEVNTAAVVPFGDWNQFTIAGKSLPQADVGTLVLRKVDLRRKYFCPLCDSKDTKTVLMWEDRSDHTLICNSCLSSSIILESEPRV